MPDNYNICNQSPDAIRACLDTLTQSLRLNSDDYIALNLEKMELGQADNVNLLRNFFSLIPPNISVLKLNENDLNQGILNQQLDEAFNAIPPNITILALHENKLSQKTLLRLITQLPATIQYISIIEDSYVPRAMIPTLLQDDVSQWFILIEAIDKCSSQGWNTLKHTLKNDFTNALTTTDLTWEQRLKLCKAAEKMIKNLYTEMPWDNKVALTSTFEKQCEQILNSSPSRVKIIKAITSVIIGTLIGVGTVISLMGLLVYGALGFSVCGLILTGIATYSSLKTPKIVRAVSNISNALKEDLKNNYNSSFFNNNNRYYYEDEDGEGYSSTCASNSEPNHRDDGWGWSSSSYSTS